MLVRKPLLLAILLLLALPGFGQLSSNVSVFATGLNNPRGLKFGPDGSLYVAEGGSGGTHSTAGKCPQVVPPIGPYTGGFTARISKINRSGVRSTVASGLPSAQTSSGLVSGVADIAFLGHQMYALISGAGCSHGILGVPNSVIRVNNNGSWRLVADLSAFLRAHPVKHPQPDDFEPDGTWYTLIAYQGNLYATEPNHGEIDSITPGGVVTRLIDVSATQGHIVPTGLAHEGNEAFYMGNLLTFPIQVGSSGIYRIDHLGRIKKILSGLTAITGVLFRDNIVYVLEMSVAQNGPVPGTGKVVRISESGAGGLHTVASGLTFPTAMTFGPDGKLYVSNFGFGFPPGSGQIVRIDLH